MLYVTETSGMAQIKYTLDGLICLIKKGRGVKDEDPCSFSEIILDIAVEKMSINFTYTSDFKDKQMERRRMRRCAKKLPKRLRLIVQ